MFVYADDDDSFGGVIDSSDALAASDARAAASTKSSSSTFGPFNSKLAKGTTTAAATTAAQPKTKTIQVAAAAAAAPPATATTHKKADAGFVAAVKKIEAGLAEMQHYGEVDINDKHVSRDDIKELQMHMSAFAGIAERVIKAAPKTVDSAMSSTSAYSTNEFSDAISSALDSIGVIRLYAAQNSFSGFTADELRDITGVETILRQRELSFPS